ncbi:Uncharacterized protein TCM_028909 [Theobroma cacao]|uniref:Uncharacterized protein n=1 Tax=Theobroma cacao TaxID=3641 RepID=A0A061GAN7_THECC|nr:Uncharacterized protein TCM_028909 [Theobroma cacao]
MIVERFNGGLKHNCPSSPFDINFAGNSFEQSALVFALRRYTLSLPTPLPYMKSSRQKAKKKETEKNINMTDAQRLPAKVACLFIEGQLGFQLQNPDL